MYLAVNCVEQLIKFQLSHPSAPPQPHPPAVSIKGARVVLCQLLLETLRCYEITDLKIAATKAANSYYPIHSFYSQLMKRPDYWAGHRAATQGANLNGAIIMNKKVKQSHCSLDRP